MPPHLRPDTQQQRNRKTTLNTEQRAAEPSESNPFDGVIYHPAVNRYSVALVRGKRVYRVSSSFDNLDAAMKARDAAIRGEK